MSLPGPDQLRSAIAALDPTEKKVLGGMIIVMIQNHQRIKDREWVAECFTRLAVGALELPPDRGTEDDIAAVNAFIEGSMGRVLNVAFPLFTQVAADLEARTPGQPFTLEDACTQALSYFTPKL